MLAHKPMSPGNTVDNQLDIIFRFTLLEYDKLLMKYQDLPKQAKLDFKSKVV